MVEEEEAVGAYGSDKHGSIVRFFFILWLYVVAWRELRKQFFQRVIFATEMVASETSYFFDQPPLEHAKHFFVFVNHKHI
jgi:hypothetical protein